MLANETQYILEIELPGVKKEDIPARVDDDGTSIIIEGSVSARQGEGEVRKMYGERRVQPGEFARTIPLPGPVEKESVRAKLSEGVLVVTLVKVTVEEPQGIAVDIE